MEEDRKERAPPPHLIEGVLRGNGVELSFLLRAVAALLCAHHEDAAGAVGPPLRELGALLGALGHGRVPCIDLDEPGPRAPPNPDAAEVRELLLHAGRCTLIHAMASCVSVQRRVVVGAVYDHLPGRHAALGRLAREDPGVRWARYRPLREEAVRALFVHAREMDNLALTGLVETLDIARRWVDVVLPDIERYYAAQDARGGPPKDEGREEEGKEEGKEEM